MKDKVKQGLALMLAFSLGFVPTAYAADVFRFADSSNNSLGEIDDQGNVVFRSSHTASAYFGDGSNLTGITADTADALTLDPQDCGANTFATAIAADGDLTCSSITDADVPDGITISLAATATALALDPSDCGANEFATTIAADGDLTCASLVDADVPDTVTINHSSTGDITLSQGASEAPTSEGVIGWDSDDDRLVVGDGSTTKTFYSGAHTVDTTLSGSAAGGDLSGTYPNPSVSDDSHNHGDSTISDTLTIGASSTVSDSALSANVSLLGSAISPSETDFIELKDTTANICGDTPSATGMLAISTDDFDLYTSTGTGVGDYRNTRTGAGPC